MPSRDEGRASSRVRLHISISTDVPNPPKVVIFISSGGLGSRPFVQPDPRRGRDSRFAKRPLSLQPLYPKKQSLGENGPFWGWRSGVKGCGTPRLPSTTLVGPRSLDRHGQGKSKCACFVVLSAGNGKCLRVVPPITLAARYWSLDRAWLLAKFENF